MMRVAANTAAVLISQRCRNSFSLEDMAVESYRYQDAARTRQIQAPAGMSNASPNSGAQSSRCAWQYPSCSRRTGALRSGSQAVLHLQEFNLGLGDDRHPFQ